MAARRARLDQNHAPFGRGGCRSPLRTDAPLLRHEAEAVSRRTRRAGRHWAALDRLLTDAPRAELADALVRHFITTGAPRHRALAPRGDPTNVQRERCCRPAVQPPGERGD